MGEEDGGEKDHHPGTGTRVLACNLTDDEEHKEVWRQEGQGLKGVEQLVKLGCVRRDGVEVANDLVSELFLLEGTQKLVILHVVDRRVQLGHGESHLSGSVG